MTFRIEKVNSLIRRELSEQLQSHLKDPRLGNFVMITGVDTSVDLKYAKVYVNCISGEGDKGEILKALASASGYLHREFVKTLNLRRVPELSFHWDDSVERGDRIMTLIDQVSAEHTD